LELRTHRRLPLETIRALLQRMEADPTYRFLVVEQLLHEDAFAPDFHPLSRTEAAAQAGLTEAQVRELEALGLVLPCPKTGRFDEEAVHLLRVLAGLLEMGFTPEDLHFYARWAQEVARHERALFADLCQDGSDEAEKVARYQRFRELAGPLLRLLHLNYLRRTLYDLLGASGQGTEG
ncbi:MAG: MerR family transcriptional regulator, partial [Chloroflexi bacterium]